MYLGFIIKHCTTKQTKGANWNNIKIQFIYLNTSNIIRGRNTCMYYFSTQKTENEYPFNSVHLLDLFDSGIETIRLIV